NDRRIGHTLKLVHHRRDVKNVRLRQLRTITCPARAIQGDHAFRAPDPARAHTLERGRHVPPTTCPNAQSTTEIRLDVGVERVVDGLDQIVGTGYDWRSVHVNVAPGGPVITIHRRTLQLRA